jgi:hypothetical protein
MKWLQRDWIRGDYLGVCVSEDAWYREMKSMGIKSPGDFISRDANATTHFLNNSDGRRAVVVCLRHDPSRTGIQVAALLAHEAVHVFQHYCEYIGEHSPSSEFEAYCVQNIFQELAEGYAQLTDKAGYNSETGDKMLISCLRQLYEEANIELPVSFDTKKETKRLLKALRGAA